MSSVSKPFLRGLESDLRALCAEAKRRDPAVKDTAERVILLLKEADTPQLEAAAADEAAAAFCAACRHPPDSSEGTALYAAQTRVVSRAVSCVHKLLTHRAVAARTLPAVIDALQILAASSFPDDTITLKVLQALLSLLTSRSYLRALTGEQLACSFSLLFMLRTSSSGVVSTGPLAAIAGVPGVGTKQNPDAIDGVIELTSKAAFRQVALDLFVCAAAPEDSAEGAASTHQSTPESEGSTGTAAVMSAAVGLCQDLCAILSGDELQWLKLDRKTSGKRIDTILSLEVLESALRENKDLFATLCPELGEILSARLCPAVHALLRSAKDRAVLKAVFALVISLVSSYWRSLMRDCEVLLSCLARMAGAKDAEGAGGDGSNPTWASVYAVEALRSIFHSEMQGIPSTSEEEERIPANAPAPVAGIDEPTGLLATSGSSAPDGHGADATVVPLFELFDMQPGDSHVVGYVLECVCTAANGCFNFAFTDMDDDRLTTLQGPSSKPFLSSTGDPKGLLVVSAAALCMDFCSAVRQCSERGKTAVCTAMLNLKAVRLVVDFLQNILAASAQVESRSTKYGSVTEGTSSTSIARTGVEMKSKTTTGLVASGLVAIGLGSDVCGAPELRALSVTAVAEGCRVALSSLEGGTSDNLACVPSRVTSMYRALFALQKGCGTRFEERSWRDFVEATRHLDMVLYSGPSHCEGLEGDSSASLGSSSGTLLTHDFEPSLASFRSEVDSVFSGASSMSWDACNNFISALVTSSRSSLSAAVKEESSSSVSSDSKESADVRIFGMTRAESVLISVFADESDTARGMPHGLWQLLTGHLVTAGCDAALQRVRTTAINSLVRLASAALESKRKHLVQQECVFSPFADLLTSSHVDTREGCLTSVYQLLETRGELVKGRKAWLSVLSILRASSGATSSPSASRECSTNHGREVAESAETGLESRFIPRYFEGENCKMKPANLLSSRDATRVRANSETVISDVMVQHGFRVVQLIADDFLSFLARDTLSEWVSVVGAYALQSRDVNVALTAVGLLWRTADFFAKSCGSGGYDGLWMDVFAVLRAIGCDDRPEVRNGAVKTLTSTLRVHGVKLSALAWRGCVERALLPLLEEVMHKGSSDGGLPGRQRKKDDSDLVLHYSRDTPRKQWNETRVLALGGVSDVLRNSMPKLASLRDEHGQSLLMLLADGGASGLWSKMLRSAGMAASSTESEVALAGVSAILELLHASGAVLSQAGSKTELAASNSAPLSSAHGLPLAQSSMQSSSSWVSGHMSPVKPPASKNQRELTVHRVETADSERGQTPSLEGPIMLWDAVWEALIDAVNGTKIASAESSGDHEIRICNEAALVMLCSGLGHAREAMWNQFTRKSSMALISILAKLISTGRVSASTSSDVGGNTAMNHSVEELSLTKVQMQAILVVESLSCGEDEETWRILLDMVLRLFEERVVVNEDILLRRLILVVRHWYEGGNSLPLSVKSRCLHHVITVLGQVMCHHHAQVADAVTDISAGSSTGRGSLPVVVAPKLPLHFSKEQNVKTLSQESQGNSRLSSHGGVEYGEEYVLWADAVDCFVVVMREGLAADCPAPPLWTALYEVSYGYLFSPRREKFDAHLQPRCLAECSVLEQYDILFAECVRDALGKMVGYTSGAKGEVGERTLTELVNVLTRGAQEGTRGRRPRFVRACQSCLFALANWRWPGVDKGSENVTVNVSSVADVAAACVVKVADSVLRRFVADRQRAGKCPLPAARRAEAVFLLRRLQGLRLRSEGGDAQRHLRTLHVRLCECVDIGDDAVRGLARAVLDESAPGGGESSTPARVGDGKGMASSGLTV